MKNSALAGMMCQNPKFQHHLGATCSESAAARGRSHCGITNRRDLDGDKRTAALFHDLRREFAYGEMRS